MGLIVQGLLSSLLLAVLVLLVYLFTADLNNQPKE